MGHTVPARSSLAVSCSSLLITTTATTHDQKEVAMKSQTTNSNRQATNLQLTTVEISTLGLKRKTMKHVHYVLFAFAVLALITMTSATPASAQTITSGSFQLSNDSGGVFTLSGGAIGLSGFTTTGIIYVPVGFTGVFCNPCGTELYIDAGGFGQDFGGGAALTWLPKVSFPILNWGAFNPGGPSGLFFTGPGIPINGPGIYTGPVSYVAVLCGQIPGHDYSCAITVPPQKGSGHLVVHIAKDPNTGFLYTTAANYLIP
jgi:hypothetical protein